MTPAELDTLVELYEPPDGVEVASFVFPETFAADETGPAETLLLCRIEVGRHDVGGYTLRTLTPIHPLRLLPADLIPVLIRQAIEALDRPLPGR